MEYTFCDITAFHYWRLPPQVLGLCPPVSLLDGDPQRYSFVKNQTVAIALGLPVWTLVHSRKNRSCSENVRQCLFLGELPSGSVCGTDHGFEVTSPLMTAFIMARHLSDLELVFVLSEMCGEFAVCHLPQELELALTSAIASRLIPTSTGWNRSPNSGGGASNLWQREHLVTGEDLVRFCKDMRDVRGGARFSRVVQYVPLGTASPFEVETALLLGLDRVHGGYGFDSMEINAKIKLTNEAKRLVNKKCLYADILLTSADGLRRVVVECQGKGSHGKEGDGLRDADRMIALQTMGYTVFLLTHKQIKDRDGFRTVVAAISRSLEIDIVEKTADEIDAEDLLRSELFIDWANLGKRDQKSSNRRKRWKA